MTAQGADSITIICDDGDDVRALLRQEESAQWLSTHMSRPSHGDEQRLRMTFREATKGVQLTTVTLAQGWDFRNVIFISTKDMEAGRGNVL